MSLDFILAQHHISCHEKKFFERIGQNVVSSFEECLFCNRIGIRIQNIHKEIVKLYLHCSCKKIQQQNNHNRKCQFPVSYKRCLLCNIPFAIIIRIDKLRIFASDLIKELVHVSDLRNSKIHYFDFVNSLFAQNYCQFLCIIFFEILLEFLCGVNDNNT